MRERIPDKVVDMHQRPVAPRGPRRGPRGVERHPSSTSGRACAHSAGLLIGDSSDHVSVHHNLLVHNSFRNPLIIDGGTHDVVNNVIYNWGDIPGEIVDTDSNSFLNFVANYYLPGPSSQIPNDAIIINGTTGTPQIYVEGNFGRRRPTEQVDEWAIVTTGWGGDPASEANRALARFPTPAITTWTSKDAFEVVLGDAGATKPRRDPIDQRVVGDVTSGAGKVIDSPPAPMPRTFETDLH